MVQKLRKYRITDSEMFQDADTLLSLFKKDEEIFRNFNPAVFTPTFTTEYADAVNAAMIAEVDNYIIDVQAEKREKLQQFKEKLRSFFRLMRFLLQNAFPDNNVIREQFGIHHSAKALNSYEDTVSALSLCQKAMEDYSNELTAAGMPQAMPVNLAALKNEFELLHSDYVTYKEKRRLLTFQRIELYNRVWDNMILIHKAAQIIFYDNYAKQKIFSVKYFKNRPGRKKKKAETEV